MKFSGLQVKKEIIRWPRLGICGVKRLRLVDQLEAAVKVLAPLPVVLHSA
jgi:hypothetical protein